jgi:hypothetical protein
MPNSKDGHGMKLAYRILFAGMLAIVFCGTAVA